MRGKTGSDGDLDKALGGQPASQPVCVSPDILPPACVFFKFIFIVAAVTGKTTTLQSWWFFFFVLVIESLHCHLCAESVSETFRASLCDFRNKNGLTLNSGSCGVPPADHSSWASRERICSPSLFYCKIRMIHPKQPIFSWSLHFWICFFCLF